VRLAQILVMALATVLAAVAVSSANASDRVRASAGSCASGNVAFTYTATFVCGEGPFALATYLHIGPAGTGWRAFTTESGAWRCRGSAFAGICTRSGKLAGRMTWIVLAGRPCSFAGVRIAFFGAAPRTCTRVRAVLGRYERTGGDYVVPRQGKIVIDEQNDNWLCKGNQYAGHCETGASGGSFFAWSA
jgi:hypothetical protein